MTSSREHVRTNSFGCFGKRPARVSLMYLAEFVVILSSLLSLSLSVFVFLTLSLFSPPPPPPRFCPLCSTPWLSHSQPRDMFHRPLATPLDTRRVWDTYVWLREMLLCISSRMFDGALLFKHRPRHHRWTDRVFGSAYVPSLAERGGDDVHLTPRPLFG